MVSSAMYLSFMLFPSTVGTASGIVWQSAKQILKKQKLFLYGIS